MLWRSPHFGPLREIEGGDDAQTVAMARLGGGDSGGVPAGATTSERRGHALGLVPRHIIGVWAVWFVSLLSLAPDFTGPLDWTVAGHTMAGERFLFVPALSVWSLTIWWAGRRTDRERDCSWHALFWAAWALAWAPGSFVWGDGSWLLHQFGVLMLQAWIVGQCVAWAAAARIERGGVRILAAGAALELLIFAAVQSGGWDAACDAGLGLTCLEGPWVTAAPAELELLGLVLWTGWLTRKLSRGER